MKQGGRFKQAKVYVRKFDEVTIVILNHETIYALPTHGTPNIIYHRFFGPIGSYPEWRLFRNSLRYNKKLTRKKITSLALKHGIENFGTSRVPNLEGKKVHYENLKKGGKCK